jgi:5-methyltetrahydrofolate--homocysteine methyltransferase
MIIIAEKINASRPGIKKIIESRDARTLGSLARKQVQAGANFIDINVGTGSGTGEDEIESMQWAVRVVAEAVEKPLCIDSADAAVLEAGLAAGDGRAALINSTKAEDRTLEAVVSLAHRYEAALVALAMDETGIPHTVEGRLAACHRIAESCKAHGVPFEKVYFDPLVIPVSIDATQGMTTLETLGAVKAAFPGARTTLGLSNVSFGLPARSILNAAFLHMALYTGLDAAIMDPLDEALMAAIRAGEALVGRDRHFRRYTRTYRRQAK